MVVVRYLRSFRINYWCFSFFILASSMPACAQDSQQKITFTKMVELQPLDPQGGHWFGFALAASGNRIAVSAINDDQPVNSAGAVYLFELEKGKWSQIAKLNATDATGNDNFGFSVAMHGDLVLIGAPWHKGVGERSGAAYIFQKKGDNWIQQVKLIPQDAKAKEEFGYSVALQENTAVVGLALDDDNLEPPPREGLVKRQGQGAVYIFENQGSNWVQTQRITAPEWKTTLDGFGQSLALSDNTLVIGAYSEDHPVDDAGSAYVYQRELNPGSYFPK